MLTLRMHSVNKTNTTTYTQQSQAFSLIELVVVILIMGLVYSLVATSFTRQSTTAPTLTIENLKMFMLKALKEDEKVMQAAKRTFYVYGDNCQNVAFKPPIETLEFDEVAFSSSIKAYSFDAYATLRQKEFAPLKIDNQRIDVCFAYSVHTNTSSDELIVKQGNEYYYLPAFFGNLKRFDSLDEARKAMLKEEINPNEVELRL